MIEPTWWLCLAAAQRATASHLAMRYIEEPDAIGRDATPGLSAVIRQSAEEPDAVLARFLSARLINWISQSKIDFIVTSDHGMATFVPDKYVNLGDYHPGISLKFVFDGKCLPFFISENPIHGIQLTKFWKKVPEHHRWEERRSSARYHYIQCPHRKFDCITGCGMYDPVPRQG